MFRFHPRYSLRSFAIAVALVCVYFALWDVTKKHGVGDYQRRRATTFIHSPFPLVVAEDELLDPCMDRSCVRQYRLWLLGPVIQLPFKVETTSAEVMR